MAPSVACVSVLSNDSNGLNDDGKNGGSEMSMFKPGRVLLFGSATALLALLLSNSVAISACILVSQGCVAFALRRVLLSRLRPVIRDVRARVVTAPTTLRTRWKEAALQPIVAALVGWLTNWIAVQAIFYPIEYVGLPIKRFLLGNVCGCDVFSPLGVIGWQGIVPAKAPRMAGTMVDVVTSRLLSVDEVFSRVDPRRISELFVHEANAMATEVGSDSAPPSLVMLAASRVKHLPSTMLSRLQLFRDQYIAGLVQSLQGRMGEVLDLKHLVVNELTSDKKGCVEVFRTTGKRELSFLTDSGLWFGFLLGLLQMLVWAVFDNGFTTTIGGLLVGYATNWLALKCIFSPVNPVYIFGFKFQGLFLKRQDEVAYDFSDFLSARVLTSEKIWQHVLGPGEEGFRYIVKEHTEAFASSAADFRETVGPRMEDSLQSLSSWIGDEVVDKLPFHVHVLHSYIDSMLGLRELLCERLKQMEPREFERVLHPIFEEDEFTLILAGAALGGMAGFLQYLLGKKIPVARVPASSLKAASLHSPSGNDVLESEDSDISTNNSQNNSEVEDDNASGGLSHDAALTEEGNEASTPASQSDSSGNRR